MIEPDVSNFLTVAEAIEIIDAASVSPRVEEVALADAEGLRLAEPIRADRDYPPFDKGLMDGYAVRAGDGDELRVIGEVAAGAVAARGVGIGEAMAIMTGAPLPEGADAVVPVEDVTRTPSPLYSGERAGDRGERFATPESAIRGPAHLAPPPSPLPASGAGEKIQIHRAALAGRNIARRGSEMRGGEIVLERGVALGPAQIAVAATVGAQRVRIFKRPRVGVLVTGDELIDVEQTPSGAQIRNSNGPMLVSLLKRLGGDVVDLGVARDEPDVIRAAIERGLQLDVLFVSGGMSMGAHDHVPRLLRELGVDLKITKLKIKPGKPFVFGVKNDSFVFGLPGNPVSGFVCTVRLASRLIARLAGGAPKENWISAKLISPLPANGPREFYMPAILRDETVQPLAWKGSADVFTLARANALLVRKENEGALERDMIVRVLEV